MKLNNIFFYVNSSDNNDEKTNKVTIDFSKTLNETLAYESVKSPSKTLNLNPVLQGEHLILTNTTQVKSLRKRVSDKKNKNSISQKWIQLLQLTLLD